ncbi:MAG: group III truncated hemoglobin [Flavobacteriales bacterium]|nr:group III truncated hemoglobin [Flavobacteriales bacterium]
MKGDITNKLDISLLVDEFYGKVLQDELLAPHFAHLDFMAHKPKMVFFWSFALLNEPGYTTNVFEKHRDLKIDKRHFDRWLALFHQTVDELFSGETAETAKLRASSIGWSFAEKMKSMGPS